MPVGCRAPEFDEEPATSTPDEPEELLANLGHSFGLHDDEPLSPEGDRRITESIRHRVALLATP